MLTANTDCPIATKLLLQNSAMLQVQASDRRSIELSSCGIIHCKCLGLRKELVLSEGNTQARLSEAVVKNRLGEVSLRYVRIQ